MNRSTEQSIRFAARQAGGFFFIQNCRLALRFVRKTIVRSLFVTVSLLEVWMHMRGHR